MLHFQSTIFRLRQICDIFTKSSFQNFYLPAHCIGIPGLNVPMHLYRSESTNATLDSKYGSSGSSHKTHISEKVVPALQGTLLVEELKESDLILVFRRFGMQGLNINFLKQYNLRVTADLTTLLFPFYSFEKTLSAIQKMVYNEEDIKENITYSYIGVDDEALFGWSLIEPDDKELVVTSNPLDAVAVNQSTGVPAISLPFVDPLTFSFSSRLLAALNIFNKVIFWMKPDLHKFKNHKLLGRTLKKKGFYIWSHEFRNPLFCLQSGSNMQKILMKSLTLYDERITYYDDYEDLVFQEMNPEKVTGVKWQRFSALNDVLKGHRTGELTVFSGQTGTGKTTFMSEYSLDLCMQGVPTLWVNLEIPNPRLLKTMLCQFSRRSFSEKDQEQLLFWSTKFKEIDMSVLNICDRYSVDNLLAAMLKSISLCEIQHIIIDNLQFMIYTGELNTGFDHLRRQDQIFSAFREFATFWNCHITVIIHPRKEPEFSELSITSIAGTAKATQEADNVLILQTTKTRQFLQVAKNRFDGCKGCILLQYDEISYTYRMKKNESKGKTCD